MPVRKLQSYEVDYQEELSQQGSLDIKIIHLKRNLMPTSRKSYFC